MREPWEPLLGNLGTFTWEPGNLCLGTWEPLLGNLYLGTWEPLLGNLYLGTCTGNLYLEPGNLGGMSFGAAPVCSETFTMAEDPKAFCCWGTKDKRKKICRTDGEARQARFVDAPLLAGNATILTIEQYNSHSPPRWTSAIRRTENEPTFSFWLLVTPLFQGLTVMTSVLLSVRLDVP